MPFPRRLSRKTSTPYWVTVIDIPYGCCGNLLVTEEAAACWLVLCVINWTRHDTIMYVHTSSRRPTVRNVKTSPMSHAYQFVPVSLIRVELVLMTSTYMTSAVRPSTNSETLICLRPCLVDGGTLLTSLSTSVVIATFRSSWRNWRDVRDDKNVRGDYNT